MGFFTDKQLQFMYNHKIITFILFALFVVVVLAVVLLLILALIYGKSVFDFSLWL